MKNIILFVLSIFFSSGLFAQITILSTDLLDVGDSIQLASVPDVPPGFKPGPSGPDQHWDFSNLIIDDTTFLSFVDPATTPYGASFPGSNIAVEGMVVAGFQIEGWAYCTKNMTAFQIDGAAGSYNIFEGIVVPFDPPEVMFDFPVNYLDSLNQTTTIDIKLDSPEPAVDSIRVKAVSTVETRVDAWGEVITPVWSGDVLRFRDVRTTIDSSWVKLLFFWVFLETNTNIMVTYKYMGNNLGYPVLTFNADTAENNFSSVNYMLVEDVGQKELSSKDQVTFDIYPNPASTFVYCRIHNAEVDGEVSVYDLNGRQIQSLPVTNNQQLKIDVSAYPAGIYQMVLRSEGKGISAKKFIVR